MSYRRIFLFGSMLCLIHACKAVNQDTELQEVTGVNEPGSNSGFLVAYATPDNQDVICMKKCGVFDASREGDQKALVFKPKEACEFLGMMPASTAAQLKDRYQNDKKLYGNLVDPLFKSILEGKNSLIGYVAKDDRRKILDDMVAFARKDAISETLCDTASKTDKIQIDTIAQVQIAEQRKPTLHMKQIALRNHSGKDLNVTLTYPIYNKSGHWEGDGTSTFLLKNKQEELYEVLATDGTRYAPVTNAVVVYADVAGTISFSNEFAEKKFNLTRPYVDDKWHAAVITFKSDFSYDAADEVWVRD